MSYYTSTYTDIRPYPDAALRTQGGWISAQLDNLWPKTSDTGQINWATVTAQNANADDYRGYEIRKSNDGLKDVYLKIEYGSGYGWFSWSLKLTVGSGSDGAGTLTGASGTVRMRTAMAYPGNVVIPGKIKVSGDGGRLSFAFCEDRPGADGYFSYTEYWGGVAVVQRFTDADGDDNENGVVVWTVSDDGASGRAWVTGLDWTAGERALPAVQGLDTTGSPGCSMYVKAVKGDASNVPVYPFGIQTAGGIVLLRDVAFVPRALQALQGTGSFSHMGASRTYVCGFGKSTSAYIFGVTQPETMSIMVRYE